MSALGVLIGVEDRGDRREVCLVEVGKFSQYTCRRSSFVTKMLN